MVSRVREFAEEEYWALGPKPIHCCCFIMRGMTFFYKVIIIIKRSKKGIGLSGLDYWQIIRKYYFLI